MMDPEQFEIHISDNEVFAFPENGVPSKPPESCGPNNNELDLLRASLSDVVLTQSLQLSEMKIDFEDGDDDITKNSAHAMTDSSHTQPEFLMAASPNLTEPQSLSALSQPTEASLEDIAADFEDAVDPPLLTSTLKAPDEDSDDEFDFDLPASKADKGKNVRFSGGCDFEEPAKEAGERMEGLKEVIVSKPEEGEQVGQEGVVGPPVIVAHVGEKGDGTPVVCAAKGESGDGTHQDVKVQPEQEEGEREDRRHIITSSAEDWDNVETVEAGFTDARTGKSQFKIFVFFPFCTKVMFGVIDGSVNYMYTVMFGVIDGSVNYMYTVMFGVIDGSVNYMYTVMFGVIDGSVNYMYTVMFGVIDGSVNYMYTVMFGVIDGSVNYMYTVMFGVIDGSVNYMYTVMFGVIDGSVNYMYTVMFGVIDGSVNYMYTVMFGVIDGSVNYMYTVMFGVIDGSVNYMYTVMFGVIDGSVNYMYTVMFGVIDGSVNYMYTVMFGVIDGSVNYMYTVMFGVIDGSVNYMYTVMFGVIDGSVNYMYTVMFGVIDGSVNYMYTVMFGVIDGSVNYMYTVMFGVIDGSVNYMYTVMFGVIDGSVNYMYTVMFGVIDGSVNYMYTVMFGVIDGSVNYMYTVMFGVIDGSVNYMYTVMFGAESMTSVPPLLSFAHLWQHFRTMDHSAVKDKIHVTVEKKGLTGIISRLFGPPRLHKDLHADRELLFCIAATAFDNGDTEHIQSLQTIYRVLTGSRFNCPRYGSHWEEIGFQGRDPATDLRGTGMLALVQLVSFLQDDSTAQIARDLYKLALHPTQNFPFCVMCINISRITLQALRDGALNRC
ncbi:hypothetical protein ACOMHN_036653 [Nucella lapillus]